MPMLNEVDFSQEPVQVIVYGPPKSGKTLVVGKLAHDYNIIWFDGEGGGQTLTQLPRAIQSKINYFRVHDTPDSPEFIATMLRVMTGQAVKVCHEHGIVTCGKCLAAGKPSSVVELNKIGSDTIVVWDSLTQATSSAFYKTAKAGGIDIEKFKSKFEFDHWGYQGNLLGKFLTMLQGAAWSNVVISHESSVEQEDGAEKVMPAGGTKNQSRNVARFFGHAVYISVENLAHNACSSTTQKNKVLAGSRTATIVDMKALSPLTPLFRAAVPQDAEPATKPAIAGNAASAVAAAIAAKKTS